MTRVRHPRSVVAHPRAAVSTDHLAHVQVFVDDVERTCDTLAGLTVSGGRSSRMDGHPDAAVAGFVILVDQLADVPAIGDSVRIDVIEPTTTIADRDRHGVVVFAGVVTDMAAVWRDDGRIAVSVNAADLLRMMAGVEMPSETRGASDTSQLLGQLGILVSTALGETPFSVSSYPDPPGDIVAGIEYAASTALVRYRRVLDAIGHTMFMTGASFVSQATYGFTHWRNELPAGQYQPELQFVNDLYGYTGTQPTPSIPCQIVVFEPAPVAAMTGAQYANVAVVGYWDHGQGGMTQETTSFRAKLNPGQPDVIRSFTTDLDQADADVLARRWAAVGHWPQPIYTCTVKFTTAVLDRLPTQDRADAVTAVLRYLSRGCAQVAFPVAVDVDASGVPTLFRVESTKLTWDVDGWLIDLVLTPAGAYVAGTHTQWPPKVGGPVDTGSDTVDTRPATLAAGYWQLADPTGPLDIAGAVTLDPAGRMTIAKADLRAVDYVSVFTDPAFAADMVGTRWQLQTNAGTLSFDVDAVDPNEFGFYVILTVSNLSGDLAGAPFGTGARFVRTVSP